MSADIALRSVVVLAATEDLVLAGDATETRTNLIVRLPAAAGHDNDLSLGARMRVTVRWVPGGSATELGARR